MAALRDQPFQGFENLGIQALSDFQTGTKTRVQTGQREPLDYPVSNVLLYQLEGLDFMCVRPSGTEPKIKIYFGCYGPDKAQCQARQKALEAVVLERVNRELEA